MKVLGGVVLHGSTHGPASSDRLLFAMLPRPSNSRASLALAVRFAINLMNFFDRQILGTDALAAVKRADTGGNVSRLGVSELPVVLNFF